ncbi:MAG: inositol-3-phosphate synthase [Planctomycetota bacterium]|nr:inositol-3-phosphate synthase [Planctomycetota bacterium]
MDEDPRNRRLGVWLIGARGAISTCVAYGLGGLRQGLIEPTGIATARDPFARLPFIGFDEIVLGGHEVAVGDMSRSSAELVRHGVLPEKLVEASSAEAAAFDARIRPGILDGPDVGRGDLDPASARLGSATPREQIECMREDIETFRREQEVDRVVVVYVASTESWREERPEWASLSRLEETLDAGAELPASSLYAYAALRAGAPFVNFTPNRGSSLGALRELARELGLPHCGNDGKTGETLMKTALAPMFMARALRVLSWQGYNMLGNRDGEVLNDPARRESKKRNKDEALRGILSDPEMHTQVSIDFVPSLHDWKTAWDFVHFEGFLGAKMSLQFTWAGSDSALAAPLVIDLVRLADFANARGEVGEMEHTACYFKSPLTADGHVDHDFHAQYRALLAYVEGHLA